MKMMKNFWCELGFHKDEIVDTFRDIIKEVGKKENFIYREINKGFKYKCKSCGRKTKVIINRIKEEQWER